MPDVKKVALLIIDYDGTDDYVIYAYASTESAKKALSYCILQGISGGSSPSERDVEEIKTVLAESPEGYFPIGSYEIKELLVND